MSQDNIIFYFPLSMQPYLRLIRLHQPTGIWLTLWPSLWGLLMAGQELPLETIGFYALVLFLGAFVSRSAGCIINDILDRDIDEQVERTQNRPLASGELSTKSARKLLIYLSVLALGLMLMLPPRAWIYCLLAGMMMAIYPTMKRFMPWPQLWLGMTFSTGALVGASLGDAPIGLAAILLFFASTFWTLGYDTIYALQDREDDKKLSIRSTAVWAKDKVRWMVGLPYILAALCLLGAFAVGIEGVGLIIGLVGGIGFGGHLGWQMENLMPENRALCASLFRSNGIIGMLPTAGLAIAYVVTAIT